MKGRITISVATLLIFSLAVSFPTLVSQGQRPDGQDPTPEELVPEEFRDQVQYLSTNPMLAAARSLGMTEIRGRSLDGGGLPDFMTRGGDLASAQVPSIADNVGIGVHPTKDENEPTVVANPQDPLRLVAGSHFAGPPAPTVNRCVAYTSSDGGAAWSEPFAMPHLSPQSSCSDPVLAYAPDGNRVYYAYMDIKPPSLGGFDIVVSYSTNNGENWVGPIIALDGTSLGPVAFMYDKPWIGTHVDVPGPQPNNSFVYVTATLFRISGPLPPNSIAFTRSTNLGLSWGNARLLDSGADPGPNGTPPFVLVQGSRPVGGLGGEVLVAWYQSGPDGWLTGSFEIRTARSGDNGLTFDPPVTAATDSFEAPFFVGPLESWYRWWLTMLPDVEIDTGGVAHLVYAHDPVAGSGSAEDGDIRYVSSAGPPYSGWTLPVTVSDDPTGQAQGFAALETVGGVPEVIFVDHRLSTPPFNLIYDVFHTRNEGGGWAPNLRVSSASSLTDFMFIGDYFDLTAGDGLFTVWTDRRDKLSPFDQEDDVLGARIPASGP